MKKILVIGIILLFIGIAIAPSINFTVVKASTDTDLVEVTTQACGIKGYGNTTVKLTKEQYQDLEQYLVDFRARLNQTSTRDEAVPIFKEAVVELNKYGLLPKGMSVEQAQKLVIGANQIFQDKKVIKKLYNNHKQMIDENTNIFCLFAGQTYDNTVVFPFVTRLLFLPLIMAIVVGVLLSKFIEISGYWILNFIANIIIASSSINKIIPIGFDQWISYGFVEQPHGILFPAHGWIYTNGFNGLKTWEDSFSGILLGHNLLMQLGTLGYTGISLYLPLKEEKFFLGTALIVKLA